MNNSLNWTASNRSQFDRAIDNSLPQMYEMNAETREIKLVAEKETKNITDIITTPILILEELKQKAELMDKIVEWLNLDVDRHVVDIQEDDDGKCFFRLTDVSYRAGDKIEIPWLIK